MPNFFGTSEELKRRSLSQVARDALDNLEKQARAILEKDATREPKLEPAEKERIAELEKRIATIEPKMDELQTLVGACETHLKEFGTYQMLDAFVKGKDFGEMVDEVAHMERVKKAGFDVRVLGMITIEESKAEIKKIKQSAREREVANGQ